MPTSRGRPVLAPGGMLERFFRTRGAISILRTAWRWKPEARFAGLSPESAYSFDARAVTAGLFGPMAARDRDALAALAERGKAFVSIGGQGGPVKAAADSLT